LKLTVEDVSDEGDDGVERIRVAPTDRSGLVDHEDPSLLHEGHAVATPGLVHVGGGDDDGEPGVAQLSEEVPELAARYGVDSRGRLVEEEELRAMHQRAAQRELLLHPAGERAGAPVAERLDLAVDRRDRLVSVLEARAEDGGEELEVLPHAQVRVEREATGHVADAGPDVPEVPDDVAPEHL